MAATVLRMDLIFVVFLYSDVSEISNEQCSVPDRKLKSPTAKGTA
jgi:hypothetical protein